MIKKDIFQGNRREQLKAASEDRLHSFAMAEGAIRGAVVQTTRMIKEMRANHELGPVETILLGHGYTAASLLVATLKSQDRISLHIQCSGPVKGMDVASNVYGEVRGYLKNSRIEVPDPQNVSSLSELFGAGFLTVTRYPEGAKNPYSGKVPLMYGSIAQDLANYFLQSEQTPTGFNLSVDFNAGDEVGGAGGIFLQAMPGAPENALAHAEDIMGGIRSLGGRFALGETPQQLVSDAFGKLRPRFLKNLRVEFFCRCSRDRMMTYISRLPADEISDILGASDFPVETRCHHCNSVYSFKREEIESLAGRGRGQGK